jgi:hypothetical protein
MDSEARELALKEPSKGSVNQVDSVEVQAAQLLPDGKSVFLYIPKMTPAMQMEIRMDLADASKKEFKETIWNTVHDLHPAFSNHGLDLANLPAIKKEALGEPGLVLSTSRGSSDDAVVVDRLALTIERRKAVSVFIPSNQAVFEGSLIIDTRGERALRIEGKGWASLKLNGNKVMEGDLPLECDPLELEAGPQAIYCHFKGVSEGTSQIRLLWSGSDFVWEPVKPSAYRYTSNSMLAKKDKAREGRNLFASTHCVKCHTADKNHFKSDPTSRPSRTRRCPSSKAMPKRAKLWSKNSTSSPGPTSWQRVRNIRLADYKRFCSIPSITPNTPPYPIFAWMLSNQPTSRHGSTLKLQKQNRRPPVMR